MKTQILALTLTAATALATSANAQTFSPRSTDFSATGSMVVQRQYNKSQITCPFTLSGRVDANGIAHIFKATMCPGQGVHARGLPWLWNPLGAEEAAFQLTLGIRGLYCGRSAASTTLSGNQATWPFAYFLQFCRDDGGSMTLTPTLTVGP
jgi:hypothetical protein